MATLAVSGICILHLLPTTSAYLACSSRLSMQTVLDTDQVQYL